MSHHPICTEASRRGMPWQVCICDLLRPTTTGYDPKATEERP